MNDLRTASPAACFLLLATALLSASGLSAPARFIAVFQEGANPSSEQIQFLSLMNQARAKAGAPPLQQDAHLDATAYAHALLMSKKKELSHQFPGEPDLSSRLLSSGEIRLDKMGENVALDVSIVGANDHLLHSPPHRKNLLDPDFNVVGLAIIHRGDQIYVVQDFGRRVTSYSSSKAADAVAQAIIHAREKLGAPPLQRIDRGDLQEVACTMARQDKLDVAGARPLSQTYHVLKYSTPAVDALPKGSDAIITSAELTKFSVGACAESGKNYFAIVLFY
jgi:uncharacterized protein YkwD